MEKFFLVVTLTSLSSLLNLIPRHKMVTLLMVSRLIDMANPLTIVVALSSPWECNSMENPWAKSSSYPFKNSKKHNHWCLLNLSTTGGCWWILLVSEGFILLNPHPISSIVPPWCYLGVEFKKKIKQPQWWNSVKFLGSSEGEGAIIDINQTSFLFS